MTTIKTMSATRAARLGALVATLATLLALAITAQANAEFGITPGTFTSSLSTTQAGAHPDSTVSFKFNTHDNGSGGIVPDDLAKKIVVNLPPGLAGDPNATPQCTSAQLSSSVCPRETQVGMGSVTLLAGGTPFDFPSPVYNMVPENGHTAEFAFVVIIPHVRVVVTVRDDGDYGLTTTIDNVSSLIPIGGSSLTFWGVPGDPSHDADRGGPSNVGAKPFMTNPTTCGVPGSATISLASWQHPDVFTTPVSSAPITMTGCDKLSFKPTIDVQADVPSADSPSGLTVDLKVPQNNAPEGLATPTLKKAVVTLPPGVSISPAAADGLDACTNAQIGIGTKNPVACPAASTIGDVSITSPLLPKPLTGAIYLGTQTAAHPFRVFLDAEGSGVRVRLEGMVAADPATGQLTTTFDNTPALAFSDFKLHFGGGPRAVLAMPDACGPMTTTAELTSAAGNVATPSSTFNVSGCSGGFTPGFTAGTANPSAGAFTPFTMQLTRGDGQQPLGEIASVSLPPGLVANVGSVPLCDAVSAAFGTCGEASQVGSASIGAGAGSHPYYLPGRVYMTQGYGGAPFGLSIVVPAIAGPINLGTVVVRASVRVNNDASLTVQADPLPQVVGGVPLRLRDVRITLDRPGFMFNPTNCSKMSVAATITSASGASSAVSSPFQVGDCGALKFAPKITASTSGKTSKSKGASLKVVITQTRGQANTKSVRVTLPKQFTPRTATVQKACLPAQFAAGGCPAVSKVGMATAVTPILGAPLTGTVYLVAQTKGLPQLRVLLSGSGIDIPLVGDVSFAKDGRTTSTFGAVPDVPLSRFELNLPQQSNSALAASGNLCAQKLLMPTLAGGQNGKKVAKTVTVGASGCKKARKAKRV